MRARIADLQEDHAETQAEVDRELLRFRKPHLANRTVGTRHGDEEDKAVIGK